MSLQGPVFAPSHRDEFYNIIGKRYAEAMGEAAKIANSKGIRMTVEPFKPVHFGANYLARGYALPIGKSGPISLLTNVAFFPYGILNIAEDEDGNADFDYMKWYEGNETDFIGDWFVLPIYYYREQQGVYKGNLAHYNFRGDETFVFKVHSVDQGFTASPETELAGWILAFVALPATLKESRVTTADI